LVVLCTKNDSNKVITHYLYDYKIECKHKITLDLSIKRNVEYNLS